MASERSVGRNRRCPCGSGLKYKKCCLRRRGVFETLAIKQRQESLRVERFGKVKPVISGDVRGHRIVAVGDELHWSQDWKTFPDFLFHYIKTVLGGGWGNDEITKPFSERHQIMQWYDGHCRFQAQQKPGKDGIHRARLNGISAAYLFLAYDLYTLRHHGALQRSLIRRLKIIDQFQGARYEAFVAATFIRAGFDIQYEDEKDGTRKHPEFLATHKATAETIAVEAKSRHRPGVLGRPGKREQDPKVGITGLLDNAIAKVSDKPYVVFIDLNLPPTPGQVFEKPWFQEIIQAISLKDDEYPAKHPYAMLVFTNVPHHYGEAGELDPARDILLVVSQAPSFPIMNPKVLEDIDVAVHQYGSIPNWFPDI